MLVLPIECMPSSAGRFAMCHYCGCRAMPLLRDYVAEHERAINDGGNAVRALDRGEYDRAGQLLAAMADELRSHWRGEENGLFAVMGKDDLYAEHIAPLVREHRELDELLKSVDVSDSDDRDRVRKAVLDLRGHIAKEEDGLFPASLTALDADEWDVAMGAWQEATGPQHARPRRLTPARRSPSVSRVPARLVSRQRSCVTSCALRGIHLDQRIRATNFVDGTLVRDR